MNTSYLTLEFRRLLKNRRFWVFSLSVPVVLFLLESSTYRNDIVPGTTFGYTAYLMCSMAAWGAIHATLVAGGRVAVERSTGWQRQLRLTPLRPGQYLLTKAAVAMLITLPAPVLLAVLGSVNGVHLSRNGWIQVVLGIWLASLPFALLGTFLGQLATLDTMQGYFGAALLLLGFVGGVLIPAISFPSWLQSVAKLMPSYWLAEIGHGVLTGNSQLLTAIAVLAGWTVVFAAAVATRYQRDSVRT